MGAATILVVAALAIVQQSGQATTPIQRMGDSARKIKSVHLLGWNCEFSPGTLDQVNAGNTQINVTAAFPRRFEAWIEGGKWRETQDFDSTIYAGGKVWINGAIASAETRPPLLTSVAFRAITGDTPFGPGVEFTSQTLGETTMEGRPTIQLVLESKKLVSDIDPRPVQERRIFWLDPQTYLPIRMEELRYNMDRWGLDAVIWFVYNVDVPGYQFDPATARSERHGPINYTESTAQSLFGLSQDQYQKYVAIGSAHASEQERIKSLPNLSKKDRDTALVKCGELFQASTRSMLNRDQQRMYDGWFYVQSKVFYKLLTPQQRAEDARWRKQQQAMINVWFDSLDSAAQKRTGRPNILEAGRE